MTQEDDELIEVHRGDKIVTVKDRFDVLETRVNWLIIGMFVMLGIHLPEIGPLISEFIKAIK